MEGLPYLGQGSYVAEKVLPKGIAAFVSLAQSSEAVAQLSIEQYQEVARSCCIDVMGQSLPYTYQRAWLGDVMLTPPGVMTNFLTRAQDEKGLLKARDEGLPLLLTNSKLPDTLSLQGVLEVLGEWKNMKVIELEKSNNFPWFTEPERFREGVTGWMEQVSGVAN